MVGFGFSEILILLLLGNGGLSSDFVSLIDAPSYFAARSVPVTTTKMIELATRTPANGKDQIGQLLALRVLAEDAAKIKKAKDYPDILEKVEEIALGKKAQDPQGFAADYARVTAAALGSTQVKGLEQQLPHNSVRQDALTWFPASVRFVAAGDFRSSARANFDAAKGMRETFLKMMPPQVWEEIYTVGEKLGNVRIDRYAVGYAPPAKDGQVGTIYLRLTGKGDAKRLVELLKEMAPGMTTKEQKGFRGARVTVIQGGAGHGSPPAMAVVGNTDFLLAGSEGPQNNDASAVEQMLAVRAGKQKNVFSGTLAGLLKKTSPEAKGIIVGELTAPMREGFTHGPDAFHAFPKTVVAELLRKKQGIVARFQGTLDSAAEAKQFSEDALRLRKKGLEALKNAPQNVPPIFPIPPKTFENLTKALQSFKVQSRGPDVSGSMTVPGELVSLFASFGPVAMGVGGAPIGPPPPNVKKIEIKEIEKKAPPPQKGSSLRVPGRALAYASFCCRGELTRSRPAITCLHEYADRR